MDVGQAFMDQMRPSAKSNMSQISSNDISSGKWKLQKNKMQQTILTLSQEVEYLSVRNSKLINDLKRKEPLYDVYVKTSEELIKLRQAHTVLISMIQSGNVNIKQNNAGAGQNLFSNTQEVDKIQQLNSSRQGYFDNPLRDDLKSSGRDNMSGPGSSVNNERLGRWMHQQNSKPQYRGGIGLDI